MSKQSVFQNELNQLEREIPIIEQRLKDICTEHMMLTNQYFKALDRSHEVSVLAAKHEEKMAEVSRPVSDETLRKMIREIIREELALYIRQEESSEEVTVTHRKTTTEETTTTVKRPRNDLRKVATTILSVLKEHEEPISLSAIVKEIEGRLPEFLWNGNVMHAAMMYEPRIQRAEHGRYHYIPM